MWNPPDAPGNSSNWADPDDWSKPSGASTPPPEWVPAGALQPDPADPLISADYAGWWSRSLAIVKAGWRKLLVLQLIGFAVAAPVLCWFSVQARLAQRENLRLAVDPLAPADPADAFAALGSGFGGIIVSFLVAALVLLASVRVVVAIATTGTADLRSSLAGSARRLFPLIGWQFLAGLLAVVAMCACVLPMFYVIAATSVLAAVVTFERSDIIARCFRLFHGDLGASVGRIATVMGLGFTVSTVGALIGAIPAAMFPVEADTTTGALVAVAVVPTLITGALGALVGVATTTLTVTAYADMRARIEPLSTQVLVQELAMA